MGYVYYFEKLEIWKLGKELARITYIQTEEFPKEEKYGIVSQLRRASLSVSNNIAEGSARITPKDQASFTTIAYASLMETLNLFIFSKEMKWISESDYYKLRVRIEELSNKLNSYRNTQLSGNK